jgi:hypothetical protein
MKRSPFERGQLVELEFIEALPEGRWIISVNGRLFRSAPVRGIRPERGVVTTVRVLQLDPLEFQVQLSGGRGSGATSRSPE